MALPTNIPQLSDLTSIVVGELSCDGIESNVLKVIGFLVQLETLEKRLESRAVKQFADEAQDSFQAFVNQFVNSAEDIWKSQLSDFEQWLAQAEQGNLTGGMASAFGPQEHLEAANADDFAIFDYDSTINNLLDPGGAHQDMDDGTGCEAGLGFSLNSSFTSSFSTAISSKLNAAGQVSSFGATLVSKAELFLQGLAETADQLNTVLNGNAAIYAAMLLNSDAIIDQLSTLTETDYSAEPGLTDFNQLLSQAIQDLKDLERRMSSGDVNTSEARKSLNSATAWVCTSDASSRRAPVISAVSSLVALLQAQIDLFRGTFDRSIQLSVNITNHRENLRTETKFQPTYASFFTKARCGLEKIQRELGVINQQNTVLFQVKRLEWCAVMKSYQALIDRYHPERFSVDLELEFETPLGQDVQELGLAVDVGDTLTEASENVLAAADKFLERVGIKLRRNIDVSLVEEARNALKEAIAQYDQAVKDAREAVQEFLAKAGVPEAKKAFNAFATAASAVSSLAPLVQAMVDGEYNTMFTLDGLNSQLSDIVAQVISKAVECCNENGADDARSKAGLIELREAQARANDDARAMSFDAHFGSSSVVPNSSVRILFDMRGLKKQYAKFKRLMNIPCLGNIGDVAKII